jgi:putative oxidoreductase
MLSRFQPRILSILRIIAAIVFVPHGLQKALGLFGGLPATLPANIAIMLKTAGWIETIGGTLLLLGLMTVPVAFILSGEMAAAFFIGHVAQRGNLLVPMANGGEPAVLYCFIFLYLATSGGGPWSMDRALGRDTTPEPAREEPAAPETAPSSQS